MCPRLLYNTLSVTMKWNVMWECIVPFHHLKTALDEELMNTDDVPTTVWNPPKIIMRMDVNNFSMPWIRNAIVALTESSVQAVSKLEISISHGGRYIFFCNYYMLLLWWKGKKVRGPTVRTLEARSLGSHPERRKEKPWTHHLTSQRFSFPIICEMRRTLAVHLTRGWKGWGASPWKALWTPLKKLL